MKRRIYTLRTDEVKKNLASFLESLPLDPLIEVIVQEKKKDRTVAQNRLYRLWGGIIAQELGWSGDEVYDDLRRRFLCKIYERDDQGYAEMINSIRKAYSMGMHGQATKMHNYIVKMTSTASATTKQFAEYLNEIERDMMGRDIVLPHPEDRYNSAMGIKDNVSKTRQKAQEFKNKS